MTICDCGLEDENPQSAARIRNWIGGHVCFRDDFQARKHLSADPAGCGDLHLRAAGKPRAWPLLLFHGAGADVTWRTWEPQMDAFAAGAARLRAGLARLGPVARDAAEGLQRLAPEPMVRVALQAMDALDIGTADVGGVSWAG